MKAGFLDRRTTAILKSVVRALHRSRVPYAIGGAVAMGFHGFARYTADLDLFARTEDRFAVFQSLRKAGLVVEEVVDPWLYSARLPGETEVRVDILFPEDALERRAIRDPDLVTVERLKGVRIFPANLLAAAKFRSDRPKDASDLEGMWRLGLFDPDSVARTLASEDSREGRAFRKRIAGFVARSGAVERYRKRPGGGARGSRG